MTFAILPAAVRRFGAIATALLMLALGLLAAQPAQALRTLVYDGQIRIYANSYGNTHGVLPSGNYSYRAIFRYDDALTMTSSRIDVAGQTRSSYDCAAQYVQCRTVFGLAAVVCGCTPEDYVDLSVNIVNDPVAFDPLGPGHQIYFPTAPDTSNAYISWTAYYKPGPDGGWGYNDGYGDVRRVESYVPEPATWALTICGFGWIGWCLRRRRAAVATTPSH